MTHAAKGNRCRGHRPLLGFQKGRQEPKAPAGFKGRAGAIGPYQKREMAGADGPYQKNEQREGAQGPKAPCGFKKEAIGPCWSVKEKGGTGQRPLSGLRKMAGAISPCWILKEEGQGPMAPAGR
jgi:hypothetical protein